MTRHTEASPDGRQTVSSRLQIFFVLVALIVVALAPLALMAATRS